MAPVASESEVEMVKPVILVMVAVEVVEMGSSVMVVTVASIKAWSKLEGR